MPENDFLFYMIDIDIYQKNYGVIETVKSDLFRTTDEKEAKRFAKNYAKNKSNFDFKYLHNKNGDYYLVTIRKYYKEETETENGEWDDWETIKVKNPK